MPTEFISAVCRRNTVQDPRVPKYTSALSRESYDLFQCGCDGGAQPKAIDPFGYRLVGCKVGANAMRLHDQVVALIAKLFRSLRLEPIVLHRSSQIYASSSVFLSLPFPSA